MQKIYFILFIVLLAEGIATGQDKVELKNADKLEGKTINGVNIREATGNVQFEHGNVKVFCNNALQYIDQNKVELKGNVRILQDTLTLTTSNAIYYGNDKTAICTGGMILKEPKSTLSASSGIYYFNQAKAYFKGNVKINNPEYIITSNELTYFRFVEESFARGNVTVTTDSAIITAENIDFYKMQGKTNATVNVKIVSDSTIITSDTLNNFAREKKSIARSNVKITNFLNTVVIRGRYLENFESNNFTLITGKVSMMQIENGKDTVFIYSDTVEAYRNKPEYFIAKDSVEIIKDKFSSKCGKAIYSKTNVSEKEKITLLINPFVWQDNMQLTGDSIYADLTEKKIEKVFVKKSLVNSDSKKSLTTIQNTSNAFFSDRFDQICGNDITINFSEGKISFCEVMNNSSSIYFAYENEKANGVNIAEGENMVIYFDTAQKVETVRIEKNVKGQFVPETMLKTVSLRLPEFVYREDKPVRRTMINE